MADNVQERIEQGIHAVEGRVKAEEAAYQQGHDRPLRRFAGVIAAYVGVVGLGGIVVRRRGGLPARLTAGDLVLASLATHKLSRLLAKDPVTSPLRAPFTRFEGTSGAAQLKEEVRGSGARQAVGELLTCPFCVGQWVATGFAFGLVIAPRPTRLVASILSMVAASDFLQYAYARAEQSLQD